jgi:DNA-binding XRE family transcriptional regulator
MHIKGMIEDGEYIPDGDEFYSVASVPLPGVDKEKINGRYLKSYRQRLGLTQSELADKLEVTKETVSEWERGRRELPGTVKFALEAVV